MKHSLETVKHSKKSARLKRELLAAQRSLASGEAKFGVALERSRWEIHIDSGAGVSV